MFNKEKYEEYKKVKKEVSMADVVDASGKVISNLVGTDMFGIDDLFKLSAFSAFLVHEIFKDEIEEEIKEKIEEEIKDDKSNSSTD